MTVDGALLRQALDTLNDVIYIYDAEGGLAYWNRRLNELYGLCDEELVGMTATEFFEPGDHAAIEAAHERIERLITDVRLATREGALATTVPVSLRRTASGCSTPASATPLTGPASGCTS